MAASTWDKVGHGLAKGLGIRLDQNNPYGERPVKVTRGESVFSVSSADTYVEHQPTSIEWLESVVPTGGDVVQYFKDLLPFTKWITRYNLQWFIGDLVAGITVGAVVVPQGMAYARLAALPVEFGLYSSFMGVLIYWFFATSKDITIGPVAVMSTIVGNIVLSVGPSLPDIEPYQIASGLSIICGAIITFLGLAKLGWLVEFIPLVAISAFLTGSALSIACGQVPSMLGITGFDTRASTYMVVINTLKNLGDTQLDAAMGLSALLLLYVIRITLSRLANQYPNKRKLLFFLSTLRTAFVILLYTFISWLVQRNRRDDPSFKILGQVPRGFQHVGAPPMNPRIISAFAKVIPASVIVLLIEHISISKSFGRINNYKIDPSQEFVAIGVTNLLGPFLGAYPATGSFSRTAIKSKAGVRTPFAGVITAMVVLLAIYALTAVFFYIPNASLSAVIIHAVGDLITPPNTVYQFWRASPLEVPIFFAGVIVTVFTGIENGIYTTICLSVALLLFRVVKARGRFMGKIQVHSVIGDHVLDDDKKIDETTKQGVIRSDPDKSLRNIFLPIDHHDGSNPAIKVVDPYPGVFIYRFSEGFNYPNANHYLDDMVDEIFRKTRCTSPNTYGKLGDRPWNDPGPPRGKEARVDETRPALKAIILDFSSVNNIDVTSTQMLIDVRNQLDRYTAPNRVEWHFACINNRWTKRALVAAGFGTRSPNYDDSSGFKRWKPIFSVAELGGKDSAAAAAEWRDNESERRRPSRGDDLEALGQRGEAEADRITRVRSKPNTSRDSDDDSLEQQLSSTKAYGTVKANTVAVVHGLNMPLFHVDLTSAVQSAIASVKERENDGAQSSA